MAPMNGPSTRRTARLLLRAPEPADIDLLFAIEGNPEAMKHTFYAPSREATVAHIHSYSARFVEDGFAPWTAVLLKEDRIVGWGGFNKDPDEPEWGTEVTYYSDQAYWAAAWPPSLCANPWRYRSKTSD